MNSFLEKIVVPYYQAQSANLGNFILYNSNRHVILASDSILTKLKFKTQTDISGKKLNDFNHIKPQFIIELEEIFDDCLRQKKPVNFVGIGGQITPPNKHCHELIFQSYEPVLDNNGTAIAILAKKLPIIKTNLFNLFFPEYASPTELFDKDLSEKLSSREFEIVYLLSNGLSQYDIARKLKISRSTVLKTLTEKIMPKFNLTRANSSKLIYLAILAGFHSKIPKTLIDEQLIIFD